MSKKTKRSHGQWLVAQLAERLLLTPDVCSLNLVIVNLFTFIQNSYLPFEKYQNKDTIPRQRSSVKILSSANCIQMTKVEDR